MLWFIIYLRFLYYYSVDTSADGLTLHEGIIIHSVVSALVYYISTFFILLLCRYLCWWTNITRGYHHTLGSQCFGLLYIYVFILLLCRYLCWWTNITRGYHHTLGSQCFGLLYIYVFNTVTLSIPLHWWTNITRWLWYHHHTLGSECFGLLYIYVFYTVTLSIPLLMD